MTSSTDIQGERLAAVHDRLIAAVESLASSDAWRAMLAVAARFHTYSPNNVLLIAVQRPDATRLAGYRAWQQLGRQVRKGEHGIAILAPMFHRAEQLPEPEAPARADAPPGRRPGRVVRGYRAVSVYDITQTDGPALQEVRPELLDGAAPIGLWADLLDQVEAAGYTFGYVDLTPANGRTDFAERTVTLHAALSGAQQVKTLAHELAHVQLHAPAVRPAGCDRPCAEVEAESVAYLVTAAHGIDAAGYTVPYVTGWADGNRDLIHSTASRVITCARSILAPPEPITPDDTAAARSVDRDPGTVLSIEPPGPATPGPVGAAMSGPLRLPALTLTTRHSPAVYPWQHHQTLPDSGVPIGINALAGGQALRYDPWACYAAGVVTSPNMIVAGQLGRGKSALVKTYLYRQLLAGRQAYILDPKGEYGPLAAATGLTVIRLQPGGQGRLNPLDRPPGATSHDHATTSRAAVVVALAGAGLGRELSGEERLGLTAAIRALPATGVLGDVVDALLHPSEVMTRELSTTAVALAAALRDVALELQRLLCGDLAGMVNGSSTVTLDPHGPGAVVDLSAVLNTDAQAAVMVCAGAWLAATLDTDTARRRLLLVDEAWALLAHTATTRWLQQISKLARARGVQLITVIHRFSDLAAQTDTGTAAHAQAQGLLADAETRVLYGQAPSERRLATDLLDLTRAEAELVCSLGPYRALWRIGEHTAVVDHVLADTEVSLVDTDARMPP